MDPEHNGTAVSHYSAKRGRPKGFATIAAARIGVSKRTINRQLAFAAGIPNPHRVVGTTLDGITQLTALAKLPHDLQNELIERTRRGEKVSARDYPNLRRSVGQVAEIMLAYINREHFEEKYQLMCWPSLARIMAGARVPLPALLGHLRAVGNWAATRPSPLSGRRSAPSWSPSKLGVASRLRTLCRSTSA